MFEGYKRRAFQNLAEAFINAIKAQIEINYSFAERVPFEPPNTAYGAETTGPTRFYFKTEGLTDRALPGQAKPNNPVDFGPVASVDELADSLEMAAVGQDTMYDEFKRKREEVQNSLREIGNTMATELQGEPSDEGFERFKGALLDLVNLANNPQRYSISYRDENGVAHRDEKGHQLVGIIKIEPQFSRDLRSLYDSIARVARSVRRDVNYFRGLQADNPENEGLRGIENLETTLKNLDKGLSRARLSRLIKPFGVMEAYGEGLKPSEATEPDLITTLAKAWYYDSSNRTPAQETEETEKTGEKNDTPREG